MHIVKRQLTATGILMGIGLGGFLKEAQSVVNLYDSTYNELK